MSADGNNHHEPTWQLSAREIALIFAFWTSLAGLSVLNRLYDPRGEGLRVITRTGPLVLPFLEAWLWAALTPPIFWVSSRSSSMTRVARVALLVLAGAAIAVFMDVSLDFLRDILFPVPRRRGGGSVFALFRGFGRFGILNQLMIYCAVLAAGFAREYFLREQRRGREAVRLEARAAQLEAQLAHARLDALRMQLNPHFLFNTLHAVSALVERDPGGVRRMIARLSELLRHTLDSRGSEEVPLRDELAFLQRYLDIMAVRFQGRLRVSTSIDGSVLDARVPNFILQPLVENALEHGVSRAGDAEIAIAARRDGDHLVISIHDRGPGFDASAESGVGLANTRARLAALYGAAASVAMRTAPEGGAAAELRLPWRDA
ncbi:MAG: sensor histidine kinase [Thermoanaerobaculia bacterium]